MLRRDKLRNIKKYSRKEKSCSQLKKIMAFLKTYKNHKSRRSSETELVQIKSITHGYRPDFRPPLWNDKTLLPAYANIHINGQCVIQAQGDWFNPNGGCNCPPYISTRRVHAIYEALEQKLTDGVNVIDWQALLDSIPERKEWNECEETRNGKHEPI